MYKRITFVFLASLVLPACASIGGNVSTLSFEQLMVPADVEYQVADISISSAANSPSNESVGAFNWGEYTVDDENLLENEIRGALETLSNPVAQDKISAAVFIHRFSQVITNQSYASLVVVDWCLHDGERVLASEVFYAGHSDELLIFTGKTLGWAKAKTLQAIANRVVNETARLVSSSDSEAGLDESNVYLDRAELLAILPKEMHSIGTPDSGNAMLGVAAHDGMTKFEEKAEFERIDWQAVLDKQASAGQ